MKKFAVVTIMILFSGAASAAPVLQGVSITGANSVYENTSTQFSATAVFKDSVTTAVTTSNVTSSATWSKTSTALISVASGLVRSAAVTTDQANVSVNTSYTYGGVTKTAAKLITVMNDPAQSLSLTCPTSVNEGSQITCSATASFKSGITKNVTASSNWSITPSIGSIVSGVYTAGNVSTDTTVTISASFTDGITVSATTSVMIINSASTSIVTGSHAGRFTTYEGSKTCAGCHSKQVTDVFNSAHYQWAGDSRYVSGSNSNGLPQGKLNGINDFCIYPKFNPGCYKCHVGSGLVPSATQTQTQLDNIDCLTCHVANYKRTLVTNSDGTKSWKPDFVATPVPFTIVRPDRAICLSCHASSGGGNNWKRGDLELAHGANSDRNFDVHMNSSGANIQCTDCHAVQNHHISGKGSDLREVDVDANNPLIRVDCTNCHLSTPHSISTNSSRLNAHTKRVHCTTCHIPTYAKSAPTDMFRDWSQPGIWDAAKNQYDPWRQMQSSVTPVYKFWNWGYATTMNLGDPAIPGANGFIDMSTPVGEVTTAGSKIFPFKYHIGNQPFDPSDSTLLPLFISDFFGSNNINLAVQNGAAKIGKTLPQGFTYVKTERYLGLFHGVTPKAQALACTECHNTPQPTRINLKSMGYQPLASRNGKALCASCHSSRTADFTTVHNVHVTQRGYDCATCHIFSKAP
jgi:hypothetical protein